MYNIICHFIILLCFQKACDRSWKPVWAVVRGQTLCLYKEKRESIPNISTDVSIHKTLIFFNAEFIVTNFLPDRRKLYSRYIIYYISSGVHASQPQIMSCVYVHNIITRYLSFDFCLSLSPKFRMLLFTRELS